MSKVCILSQLYQGTYPVRSLIRLYVIKETNLLKSSRDKKSTYFVLFAYYYIIWWGSFNHFYLFDESHCYKSTVSYSPRQLWRAPRSVNAGGPGGTTDQYVASIALEHDLSVVPDLADVGPVLVEADAAHEKDLSVLYETGEGTKDWKETELLICLTRYYVKKGWFTWRAFDACGCGRKVRCIKIELFLIFAAMHTSTAPACVKCTSSESALSFFWHTPSTLFSMGPRPFVYIICLLHTLSAP